MHRTLFGCVRIALIVVAATVPHALFAQSDPAIADKIQELEQKLEALSAQTEEIRRELDALKSSAGVAEEIEDLAAVEPAVQQPPPVQTVAAPGASKIFNPDISIIGNVVGQMGNENPFDERDPIALEEAEMSLQAFVDPYAKASFFIGFHEDEVEIEEGFVNFINLPPTSR